MSRNGDLILSEVMSQFSSHFPHFIIMLPLKASSSCVVHLARIIHKFSTAVTQSSALAVLRSVGLFDGLHEYDCGGLGRKPCQDGASYLQLENVPDRMR